MIPAVFSRSLACRRACDFCRWPSPISRLHRIWALIVTWRARRPGASLSSIQKARAARCAKPTALRRLTIRDLVQTVRDQVVQGLRVLTTPTSGRFYRFTLRTTSASDDWQPKPTDLDLLAIFWPTSIPIWPGVRPTVRSWDQGILARSGIRSRYLGYSGAGLRVCGAGPGGGLAGPRQPARQMDPGNGTAHHLRVDGSARRARSLSNEPRRSSTGGTSPPAPVTRRIDGRERRVGRLF